MKRLILFKLVVFALAGRSGVLSGCQSRMEFQGRNFSADRRVCKRWTGTDGKLNLGGNGK